ncbi:hypothetical protein OJJOAM_002503 [Cupriavidus sp. H18C1]|uniref:hypothetical protein n=1 Tax=Cupriavidus sp. H18C1 TaxID=3241601 RepID=UPI003BB89FC8
MDSARDKQTAKIVEAEQLWLLDHVDHERYTCVGCAAKATPCAYGPENKVRPYFAAKSGHEDGCDVIGKEKLVARARKGRVTDPIKGFPAPYPSRLVLRVTRQVVDDSQTGVDQGRMSGPSGARDGGGSSQSPRRHTASTIRPICRTFLDFPYDRDLPLEVPGVEEQTFLTIFKKLKNDALVTYPDARIFYASLRWSKPLETDDFMEIALDGGIVNLRAG